jgi:hypothetical protein
MSALIVDVSVFITPVAVTVYSLYNYHLVFGLPWRPRLVGNEPETSGQRHWRWKMLVLNLLTIVMAYLMVIAAKLAIR